MDEVLEHLANPAAAGRILNFSIDDVYCELAVPAFRHDGVPVTLYVTAGIPDRSHVLWQSGMELGRPKEAVKASVAVGMQEPTADAEQCFRVDALAIGRVEVDGHQPAREVHWTTCNR
jgi:hypothetical protein